MQATSGKGNQVLLQWRPAKGVGNLKIGHYAIDTLSMNKEFSLFFEKTGGHPVAGKSCIVKVAEHGLFTGNRHGEIVMRFCKFLILFRVAFDTALASDKGQGCSLWALAGPLLLFYEVEWQGQGQKESGDQSGCFPAGHQLPFFYSVGKLFRFE